METQRRREHREIGKCWRYLSILFALSISAFLCVLCASAFPIGLETHLPSALPFAAFTPDEKFTSFHLDAKSEIAILRRLCVSKIVGGGIAMSSKTIRTGSGSASTLAAFVVGVPVGVALLWAISSGPLHHPLAERYLHHPVEKV